jgi:hypothetical protein
LQSDGLALSETHQAKDGHRLCFAFDLEVSQALPGKCIASRLLGYLADQDLAWRGGLHQARRQVDLVPQYAVSAAQYPAVGARAHTALADPDLHRCDEVEGGRQVAQFQGGRGRAYRIVLVRQRSAKSGVQVTALIAEEGNRRTQLGQELTLATA